MSIPENLIPYTYSESKRIFENKLTVKEAAENIHKKCGIKVTSAADYDLDIKNPTKVEESHEFNSIELMELLPTSFEKSNALLNQLKNAVK